jgi:hypothetical protein
MAGLRTGDQALTPDLLNGALLRNFNGKPVLTERLLAVFHRCCFGPAVPLGAVPGVDALIRANMADPLARHLMLLTRNGAAPGLLAAAGFIDPATATVLVGSEFPDDRSEMCVLPVLRRAAIFFY